MKNGWSSKQHEENEQASCRDSPEHMNSVWESSPGYVSTFLTNQQGKADDPGGKWAEVLLGHFTKEDMPVTNNTQWCSTHQSSRPCKLNYNPVPPTTSRRLLKFTSQWCCLIISSSVAPFSSHLQSFPASGSFPMRWLFAPSGQSSFSISPSNEYSGLISFTMDWFDLLAVQGALKSLLQHHSSKASIVWCSAFFTVQLSYLQVTTGNLYAKAFDCGSQ